MNKLVKFRPLANDTDFDRAKQILETGKFWCTKLWNQNDPMEGVFSTYNHSIINSLFSEKNKYVICSFSDVDGPKKPLNNPLLWGYYANGFKGVAIEIDATNHDDMDNDSDFERIKYDNKSDYYKDVFENGVDVKEIITRKLDDWDHEDEVRFLKKSKKEGSYKIGKIKKVHFGTPYKNARNYKTIRDYSKTLRKYNFLKRELILICKDNNIEIVDHMISD